MPTDLYYPGVQTVEKAFQPGAVPGGALSTLGAFIGRSHQGPLAVTLVASWAEFSRLYGTNYTDLHNAVNDFYSNGGNTAAIVRIPGTGALASTIKVLDDTVVGTPTGNETPLFTVTASNPGAWGNELKLVVTPRDKTNDRFDVAVFKYPASEPAFEPQKRNTEWLIDQWLDVSLHPNDARYLYTIANVPSVAGSQFVTFSGQSYNPATPTVKPFPGTAGGTDFAGGADGTYNAPYDPAASYSAAVALLNEIDQPLILNLPNMTDGTIVKNAVAAAAGQQTTFVVVDPRPNDTPSQVQDYVNTTLALGSLGTAVPSFAAVYYPWIYMPALGSAGGRQALHPPGGAVVGAFLSTDAAYGAWRTPAGAAIVLAGASASERKLTDADLTMLNNAHVNAIRYVNGRSTGQAGFAIMGGRTTKKFGMDKYISNRRSLIEIGSNLKQLTEFAVFEPNDARLWERLRAVTSDYLAGFWQSGGLKGASVTEAFYVTCDETNNTPNVIQQGLVNIEVGVALTAPAEFVVITIGQYDGGSTVAVSAL
jgi:Bacteriophage tail sheath protein